MKRTERNNIVKGIADRLMQAVEFYEETEQDGKVDAAYDLWEQAQRFCACFKHNLFSNESIEEAREVLVAFSDDLAEEGEDPRHVRRLVRDITEYLAG